MQQENKPIEFEITLIGGPTGKTFVFRRTCKIKEINKQEIIGINEITFIAEDGSEFELTLDKSMTKKMYDSGIIEFEYTWSPSLLSYI